MNNYTFARFSMRVKAFWANIILFVRNDEQAHSIISKRLEDLLFIVDLDEMVERSAYLMRSFKAIQRDTNKINEYKKCKGRNKLLDEIKRYVEVIDQSSNLRTANFFIESSYKNENNQSYTCYLLTRKGCDMVANKMTGEKGILFTATYVTRFEEMENELKSQQVSQISSYMIQNPLERAKMWIQEEQRMLLAETVETQVKMIEE